MSLKTFDPAQMSLIVGGHIVGGFADGTFLNVARNNDSFSRTAGADGENTRVKSNDKSGRFTFTLMASSLSNGVLQGFANADELNNGGLVPVLIQDNNGTEVASGPISWVVKPADRGYAKENSNREWVIETDELILEGGGIAAETV